MKSARHPSGGVSGTSSCNDGVGCAQAYFEDQAGKVL